MKKVTLILAVLTIGAMATYSQNDNRKETRSKVLQYFEKNIFPTIEKQQTKYYGKLSDAEKQELKVVKEKIRANENGNMPMKNRGSKAGNHKAWRRNCNNAFSPEVRKITEAHPKLNKSYMNIIEKKKQAWITDIMKIHEENGCPNMDKTNIRTRIETMMTNMSNPDWLLIWDSYSPQMKHFMGTAPHNNMNMRGQKQENRELRTEIKSYAINNIIPVIAKERSDFNKVLSSKEKLIIDEARQKVQARRKTFKAQHQGNNFNANKPACNSTFDSSMRAEMQESMAAVREIAIAHDAEIKASIAKIRNHESEWKNGIIEISKKNNQDPQQTMSKIKQRMNKFHTPVSFLLFNPDKINESIFFNSRKG